MVLRSLARRRPHPGRRGISRGPQGGRYAEARRYLTDDPRIWYDGKAGAGSPWKLGGGRWQAWDDHFRSTSERVTDWRHEDARVWADIFETNEYFKLTERGGSTWRATYYFDESGQITGFMVSGVPGVESERGRRDEFEPGPGSTGPKKRST